MLSPQVVAKLLRNMTQAQRRVLAKRCGIGFETVQKIAIGKTRNPRIDTFQAIEYELSRGLRYKSAKEWAAVSA